MVIKIKKISKKLTLDYKIILLLFLMTIIFKIPILNIPHHWDAVNIHKVSLWMLARNFSPFPLMHEVYYSGHPPFFYEALALFYLIFGVHLWVSHLLVILFSFIGLTFTYLLGSYFYNRKTGLIASILLFFSPLYFSQSGILLLTIPLTALTITTIYFAIKNNKELFIISGICLALTKEPAILILLMIFVYRLLKNKNLNKTDFLKNSFIYSIPIIVFILWIICNKLIYGWFLYPENILRFNLLSSSFYFNASGNILQNFNLRFSEIFLHNPRWILTLICVILFLKNIKKTKKLRYYKNEFFLFLSIFLIILIFYSFNSIFMIRYTLLLYPLFFILGSLALTKIFKQKIILIGITIFLLILFITDWTGNRTNSCVCDLESNLEYLDSIETHKLAAKYIENNYPNSTVLTDFPMGTELSHPDLGYVDKPIKVISRFINTKGNIEDADIVYFSYQQLPFYPFVSLYNPSQELFFLGKRMLNLNLTVLATFEKNGKFAIIYKIN